MLKQVGYSITCWHEEFQQQQGIKDPFIIPHLGVKHYTWITKDDEAKKEHENEIRVANISVIWVRGVEREKGKPKKNDIKIKDLHRMLTDKLDIAKSEIEASKSPIHYLLWMSSGHKPVIKKTTLEGFFQKLRKN